MERIILLILGLICFIGIIGIFVMIIIVWVNYGNLPITEVPSWALWFMFGGGK